MTDDELKAIEQEILGSQISDPDVEREWVAVQKAVLVRNEQELMASFRMCKWLRQDDRIPQLRDDLKKVRQAIEYCAKREAELK